MGPAPSKGNIIKQGEKISPVSIIIFQELDICISLANVKSFFEVKIKLNLFLRLGFDFVWI